MASLPTIVPRSDSQDIRLIEAASIGEPADIARLLEEGVDVNDADANGVTALIMASSAGNLEAVRLLLKAGADKSVKDDLGYDAYHAAMFHGDFRGATVSPYDEIMKLVESEEETDQF